MVLWIEEIRTKEILGRGILKQLAPLPISLSGFFLDQIDRHGTRRTWHRDLWLGRGARDTDESLGGMSNWESAVR